MSRLVLTVFGLTVLLGTCETLQAEYRAGTKLAPSDDVREVAVTIQVGPKTAWDEPMALDLGLGFPFRLQPVGQDLHHVPFGAVPQDATAGPSVAAGSSATFTFRVAGSAGQDVLGTSPYLLDGVRMADVSRIGFLGTAAHDWELLGYEVKINGELLAANDAVHAVPAKAATDADANQAELRTRIAEMRRLIADLKTLEETGFATPNDLVQAAALKEQLASREKELQPTPASSAAPWFVESNFKPLGRETEPIKSFKATVWQAPGSEAATVNHVFLGVGGHKFPVVFVEKVAAAGGPQTLELDLQAVPLLKSDLRDYSLGIIADAGPQGADVDFWRADRLQVEVDGAIVYDSDAVAADKKSLGIVRLIPPAHFDASSRLLTHAKHSLREFVVWRPGKNLGLDPETLEPLPDTEIVAPLGPEPPAPVVVSGHVAYADKTSPTGYRGLAKARVIWKTPTDAKQATVTKGDGTFAIELSPVAYFVDIEVDAPWQPLADQSVTVAKGMTPPFFVVSKVEVPKVQIVGQVVTRNLATGALQGVPGAIVAWSKKLDTGARVIVEQVITNANGEFAVVLPVGNYEVAAGAAGFFDSPIMPIAVAENMGPIEIELVAIPGPGPGPAPAPGPGPIPGPWPGPGPIPGPGPWPGPGPIPGPWPGPGPIPGPGPVPGPGPIPGPVPVPGNVVVVDVLVLKLPENVPFAGAMVDIAPFSQPTGANGHAWFTLPNPGPYVVTAKAPGYRPVQVPANMVAGVNTIVIPLQKQVPDDETIPLTIRVLRDDGTKPVSFPNIDVLVYKERPAAEHQVTDELGKARFKLTGGEGSYVALASAKGYSPGEVRVQVKKGQPNFVVITLKKSTGPSTRLTVTVYRGEGKAVVPLAEATVLAYAEGGPSGHPLTDLSDENGIADFDLVDSGRYVVAAQLPGYAGAETRVQVTEGEPCSASLILYPKPAEIPLNVTVYQTKGRSRMPLVGADVMAFRYDRTGRQRIRRTTDSNGQVALSLTDGEGLYLVTATKDGFQPDAKPVPVRAGVENTAFLSLMELGDVGPEVPLAFTVRVEAQSPGGLKPAAGARVLLRHEGGTVRELAAALADVQGAATFHPASPGLYDVVVSSEGYEPKAQRVRIGRDTVRETEIIILLSPTPPTPPPATPSTPTPVPPTPTVPGGGTTSNGLPGLAHATIDLGGLSRQFNLPMAQGGLVAARVNLSSANPFEVHVTEIDRAALALVSERTEGVERKTGSGGRPLLGGPTQRRVFEFRVNENATGTAHAVIELRRPWEKQASVRYTLAIQIVPSGGSRSAIDDLNHLIDLWGEDLVQLYTNAQGMRDEFHWHPVIVDGGPPVCASGRCSKQCYDKMLPIYRALNEKEKWGLSEERLRACVLWWGGICATLPSDHPGECGCHHFVPTHTHTGW